MSFRKLFDSSNLSHFYAQTRPKPCSELMEKVMSSCRSKNLALDVGCGTGQVTSLLSPFFTRVIGVDSSQSQVDQAIELNKCNNVRYLVGSSEKIDLPSSSVDLVTCSQALHWLDIPVSLKEFKRVLNSNGILAVITYVMPFLRSVKGFSVDANFVREKVYKHKILQEYWNLEERTLIDSCYEQIDFSTFRHVDRHVMKYKTVIPLSNQKHYIDGHLHSWSPFQKLVKEEKEKANELIQELYSLIPEEDKTDRGLVLEYPYTLILAKN